ncbi:NrdH-like glutaredoxin [Mycobacterium phage ScoobyDoobyDoo]|nr:NrdH-like glutaredoxin [Mycobacterium phage ScoobyDoobyDoo]
MVTLFTKPGCQPCRLTKMKLEEYGVEYQALDITTDPDARAKVEELGYMGVPVVLTEDGQHWQGMRPDRIKELKG